MSKKDLLFYAGIAVVALLAYQMFMAKKPAAKTTTPTDTNTGTPSNVSGDPVLTASAGTTYDINAGDSGFSIPLPGGFVNLSI
jgi:hypothetical protein